MVGAGASAMWLPHRTAPIRTSRENARHVRGCVPETKVLFHCPPFRAGIPRLAFSPRRSGFVSRNFIFADRRPMLSKLIIAFLLMAACVAIHGMGLLRILQSLSAKSPAVAAGFWPSTRRLIYIAGCVLSLHLLQILSWAFLYALRGALPDFTTAAYFSAVTYTTTGYGDIVLPEEWRLVGGIEALTGILMCGLSTGMFFAIFSRIFRLDRDGLPPA